MMKPNSVVADKGIERIFEFSTDARLVASCHSRVSGIPDHGFAAST
jgi:hypothetical protein